MATVAQEDFFARVPKSIVYHPELSGNDVRVYATLSERAGSKRSTWPSVRRISQDIGVSTTTVQRSLDKLEGLGLIEVERSGGRVNRYFLPLVGTVSENDTPPDPVYQKMTRTVSETDTELDQGTRTTSPNGEVRAELFEAFYEFWTGNPYEPGSTIPKIQRQRINSAVGQALEAGITADEVRERGSRYRKEWKDLEATPQALLLHWHRFDGSKVVEWSPEDCRHIAAADRDGDGRLWCPACERYLSGVVA